VPAARKNRATLVNGCEADERSAGYFILNSNLNPEALMPAIKLHLEQAELDAVARFAETLNVKTEAILYAALNRIMLDTHNPALRTEITETWASHFSNLPLWSDSACSAHAYEGKCDDEPEPSRWL
jgi:hypothetical protein